MLQPLIRFKSGNVKLESKRFIPTELGEIVYEQVKEYSPEIIDVEFTVNMETLLDKIAEGDMNWRKVIGDFYNSFKQDVERAESEMEKIEIKDEPAGEDCEVCGSPMVIKMGRHGTFTVVTPKQLSKRLVSHVRSVMKEMS